MCVCVRACVCIGAYELVVVSSFYVQSYRQSIPILFIALSYDESLSSLSLSFVECASCLT